MAWIKGLVFGMGALLLAGFVVIVVTLVNRAGVSGDDAKKAAETDIRLETGERLMSSTFDGQYVLFHIEGISKSRIEVRKISDGTLISQFNVSGVSK